MHTSTFAGPAADFTSMGSADLAAEAKSLDALISNLEVEAFRHASSGSQQRTLEASRRAKDLRVRREKVLRALHFKNNMGVFGDLGAASAKTSPAEAKRLKEEAFRKKSGAERRIFEIQKRLEAIAKRVQGKAVSAGDGIMPSDIKNLYYEMAKAGRDFVEASGAIEVINSNNTLRRGAGEIAGVQTLIKQHSRFFSGLPFPLAKAQKEALNLGSSGYQTLLTRMSRPSSTSGRASSSPLSAYSCAANTKCSIVIRKIASRPKRRVAPTQLRAIKKQIAMARGARIPDPLVLRIIAKRIAERYPRPKDMREELYGDFILEMTKRAAIYTANEQAKGADTTSAVTVATDTVMTQDLPAIKEEVVTGVTAPAGEQVVAAAVQAAAPQIIQGAADAGAIPSVPAAPAADQAQVAQVAASADPAAAAAVVTASTAAASDTSSAAAVTDANIQAAFSTSSSDGSASTAPPATPSDTSDSLATTEVTIIAPAEAIPFYKRPAVLAVGALALVGGYMYWRSQDKPGVVPDAPTPAAE